MTRIREYREGDAPALIALFERSVFEIGPAKYDRDALEAWAGGTKDIQRWAARMRAREVFIAEDDSLLLGWVEFESDGHLDMLYCAPEAARTGVAQQLYDTALERAKALGITRFFAEASLFSESFFRRNGCQCASTEA